MRKSREGEVVQAADRRPGACGNRPEIVPFKNKRKKEIKETKRKEKRGVEEGREGETQEGKETVLSSTGVPCVRPCLHPDASPAAPPSGRGRSRVSLRLTPVVCFLLSAQRGSLESTSAN